MVRQARGADYYSGAYWFQGGVLFVLLGVLALWLLLALNEAKERAERQTVELTIRNMRTGMQYAMGEALMQQREHEIASWVGSDPVVWLGSSPSGYRGDCTAGERQALSGGEWCFERDRGVLVYQPRNSEHLRENRDGQDLPCAQLSWRVTRSPGSLVVGGLVGLRIEAASSCHWVFQ